MLVSSVPLSLTTVPGLAKRSRIAISSSRATRPPEIDVSAMSRTHSRVKSSTTAKMRNLRPQVMASDTKSRLQRWLTPCGNSSGRRVPSALLRPPPATHLQPFLTIQAPELLVVHLQTFATQKPVQTAVAKPAALCCQATHPLPDRRIVTSPARIAYHRPVYTKCIARTPLTDIENRLKMRHRLPLGGRRHHFFAPISLSIALSSIVSANSRFSRAFSSSS